MTTIRTRPCPDDGAAVTGRAATMPPVTGPGRHGRASRTRLRLAVAATGGLLAAGMITLAAAAAAGAAADRAPHGEPALGPALPGTAITLTSRANPSTAGGPVTYAATIRPAPGGGTVAFTDGTTPVPGCAAQPVENAGTATCQVAYPGAGAHAITAAYSGDARHAASTSAAPTQQVAYRMQLLGKPAASGTSGPGVPVRVVLLDAAGTNVSGPGITLTVTGLSPSPSPGTAPHGTLTAVNLGLWTCYQLTINTADYPAGSYTVSFAAGNDPTTHTAQFVVPGPAGSPSTGLATGTGPACIGQPKHRGGPAAAPWGARRARQPPPTTSYLDTRRHNPPTQPRGRHRPLNRSGPACEAQAQFTRRQLSRYPVWSTTMPANTRSPQSRPHVAPACHLARPASLRVTAVGRQRQQRLTHRTGKSRS